MNQKQINNFWRKVDKNGDNNCWIWKGATYINGYGAVNINHKVFRAHRISWEIFNGGIPDGILVCHTCDNPPCVNPAHLFLGTSKDNAIDRSKKKHFSKKCLLVRGHYGKEIIKSFRLGASVHELSRQYKVSLSYINHIVYPKIKI